MDPKTLLTLLTTRREERMAEAEAAKKESERERLLSMLPPEERRDAALFGLDYVARKRQRAEEQAFQEKTLAERQKYEEKQIAERQRQEDAAKREATEARRKEREQLIANVLGFAQEGRPLPRVPGLEAFEIKPQQQREAELREAMLRTMGLAGGAAGQAFASQLLPASIENLRQETPQIPRYKILSDAEERTILQAGGKIPTGFLTERSYNEAQDLHRRQQLQNAAASAAQAKARQKQAQIDFQIEEAHKLLKADGWKDEQIAQWDRAVAAKGGTPQAIKSELEQVAKRAEADERRGESTRAAIINLEKQINDIDFDLAEEEESFPGAPPQYALKGAQREIKTREKRMLQRRLYDLLVKKIESGKDNDEDVVMAMGLAADLGIK
jgi:hypothetical protein